MPMTAPTPRTVTIRFDDTGEHRVPGPDRAYYTDSRQDAVAAARSIHGQAVVLQFEFCEYCDPEEDAAA